MWQWTHQPTGDKTGRTQSSTGEPRGRGQTCRHIHVHVTAVTPHSIVLHKPFPLRELCKGPICVNGNLSRSPVMNPHADGWTQYATFGVQGKLYLYLHRNTKSILKVIIFRCREMGQMRRNKTLMHAFYNIFLFEPCDHITWPKNK